MPIRNYASTPFLVRGTMIVSSFLAMLFQGITLFITRDSLTVDTLQYSDELPSLQKPYWNEEQMTIPTTTKTATETKITDDGPDGTLMMNFTITERYQNPFILANGCAVTVLLVDPDLNDDVQWALESVADNIHPAEITCFLIQTSVCMLRRPNVTQSQLYDEKVDRFVRNAQPNFRALIHKGNVRMTLLNHTKYGLRSCLNFYNPSYLFENYRYWGPDEFDVHDSDQILMIQGDAVLCHNLNVYKWKDVAWGKSPSQTNWNFDKNTLLFYLLILKNIMFSVSLHPFLFCCTPVGSPWIPSKGRKPWHYCSSMPANWIKFHHNVSGMIGTSSDPGVVIPPFPTEDELCSDTRHGPQGNGGLSLRSREWIQRAIRYCPTAIYQHSGLSMEEYNATTCKATEIVAEDLYYWTILKGIGAPLPSSFEAGLFAQEMRSVGDIVRHYGLLETNQSWMDEMVTKRWYSPDDPTGLSRFRRMQKHQISTGTLDAVVSIGVHKPWNQGLKRRINERYLNEECPYMRKMVEQSKYGKTFIQPI